jgi:hypothetical protein
MSSDGFVSVRCAEILVANWEQVMIANDGIECSVFPCQLLLYHICNVLRTFDNRLLRVHPDVVRIVVASPEEQLRLDLCFHILQHRPDRPLGYVAVIVDPEASLFGRLTGETIIAPTAYYCRALCV